MRIEQIIRVLREEKGWSQEKLALEANMGTSNLSRIERGERRLPTARLEALATALGTTATDIYALAEGRQTSATAEAGAGDLAPDLSTAAIQLRRTFRKLSDDDRQLVVEFAQLLARRKIARN